MRIIRISQKSNFILVSMCILQAFPYYLQRCADHENRSPGKQTHK